LPRDLSETYDRLLSRIEGNQQIQFISKMFKWILFAQRPLELDELAEAIAFDVDDTFWDTNKIPTMSRLLQACGNLVQFDQESQTVNFSHYTVQEYLLSSLTAREEFRFTQRGANNTIGELCVTYLSFSDFQTQITRARHSLKDNMTLLASAFNEEPTLILGQDAGSTNIWKRFFKPLRRRTTAMPEITYNLGAKNDSLSNQLSKKYRLLDYIVENWLWHTRYFLQDFSGTSTSLIRFRSILLSPFFPFEITPWSTTTFSATSSHPDFPQEYLAWLNTIPSIEILSITEEINEDTSYIAKLSLEDESPIELETTAFPKNSKTVMAEETLVTSSSADGSAANGYDSDQEKDQQMDSDVSSLFSNATIDSSISALSVPLLVVQGAEEELVTVLAEDEILKPLYELAATKIKPERFERNFARLLKMYAGDLRERAFNDLQKSAVGLVRSRRRYTAKSIRLKFFASAPEQFHVIDGLRRQNVDRSMHLEHYLRHYVQSANPGSTSEVVERNSDIEDEDSEPDSASDLSEEEDRDAPAFPNLEHVRSFMSSGDALPNLRDRLKLFLEPQSSKKKELPIVDRSIQLPKHDAPVRDEAIDEISEGISCCRIDSDHISLNSPAEFQDSDNPLELKQHGVLEPEPNERTPQERGTPSIHHRSYMELSSEQCDNGVETSLLEEMVIWLQAKTLVSFSGMIYHFASVFLEPALPAGAHRLRWSCVRNLSKTNRNQSANTKRYRNAGICLTMTSFYFHQMVFSIW
jgi:hypothetical protein